MLADADAKHRQLVGFYLPLPIAGPWPEPAPGRCSRTLAAARGITGGADGPHHYQYLAGLASDGQL